MHRGIDVCTQRIWCSNYTIIAHGMHITILKIYMIKKKNNPCSICHIMGLSNSQYIPQYWPASICAIIQFQTLNSHRRSKTVWKRGYVWTTAGQSPDGDSHAFCMDLKTQSSAVIKHTVDIKLLIFELLNTHLTWASFVVLLPWKFCPSVWNIKSLKSYLLLLYAFSLSPSSYSVYQTLT